jgi:hypothetical protein
MSLARGGFKQIVESVTFAKNLLEGKHTGHMLHKRARKSRKSLTVNAAKSFNHG